MHTGCHPLLGEGELWQTAKRLSRVTINERSKLPEQVTGWRPKGFWQYAAISPFVAYGAVSAVLLLILLVVSIPASCASGPSR
ncbi:hypothetical protein ABQE45_03360 [Mycobacteroides chelonae]